MRPPPPPSGQTRITILLATWNGATHLQEQLESYLAQTHDAWDLWASDDGSSDATLEILESFRAAEAPRREVRIVAGPQRGHAANFLSLLCHPELPAGPVALSDQDDVWLPGKLTLALGALRQAGPVTLYGAQSFHTDGALRRIGRSRIPRGRPCFRNALTQNVVSGHSAVLSAGALELVRRAGVPAGIPYHDWWLYQLVSGAGGEVVIDRARVLDYRQHRQNAMGAHRGLAPRLARAKQVLGRTYAGWIAANLAALDKVGGLLTPENRALVAELCAAPPRPGLARPLAFRRLGLHRQTRLTTASLYLAAALGRV
ncbi:glycosyltransferase [Salipiger mangrovisoli]|uniref:Glycosyltransferase n=1 Tax=Salipiger mangrovisoli TaxID=2865933 RepID=A0ABR9X9T6_9RHOB|nr:glycosyltransferase [Salipiger mangrovisoli]MBE9640237.1 glycosyltransferase [Salipiger mangrovisoli]